MIVGITRDSQLGAAVMVGTGGIFAEVLRDVAVRPLPLDAADAREMIESLRGCALLEGSARPPRRQYRRAGRRRHVGGPPGDRVRRSHRRTRPEPGHRQRHQRGRRRLVSCHRLTFLGQKTSGYDRRLRLRSSLDVLVANFRGSSLVFAAPGGADAHRFPVEFVSTPLDAVAAAA